ncbi:MAG: 3-hydroxyisobutyrate dehydrogenase [Nitratireductor sp.]|nr:3-hydroxyisobutyrate dehydrogenase [Nitratireductor sp.]
MSKIGFIGLGNMGLPMAINLKKAGHDVQGFDTVPDQIEKAKAEGIAIAASAADAARGAEIIVTMLPNGAIVSAVYAQIVPVATRGALLIDSSTIDVSTAKSLHGQASTAGLLSLDAPVSGGIGGAAAGTLTFMCGGSREAFEKAGPALDVMGGKIILCGEGGAGQAAKICNNMLLSISMIGACEAFALAEKLGLSAQAAFDVMSTSSGSCWPVNVYCPVPGVGPKSPADNDYKPGFAAELMLKDASLAQQAATEVGQATPMGQYAATLYQHFLANGGAGKDFSGIIEYLKRAQRGNV